MSNTQAYNGGVTYNQPITRRTAGKAAAVGLSGLMALAPATVGAEEKTPVPSTNIGQHVLQLEEGQTRPLKDINAQLKKYGLEIADMAKAERELSRYGLASRYQNAQQANGQSGSAQEASGTPWYKNPKVIIPIVAGGVVVGYLALRDGGSQKNKPPVSGGTIF